MAGLKLMKLMMLEVGCWELWGTLAVGEVDVTEHHAAVKDVTQHPRSWSVHKAGVC